MTKLKIFCRLPARLGANDVTRRVASVCGAGEGAEPEAGKKWQYQWWQLWWKHSSRHSPHPSSFQTDFIDDTDWPPSWIHVVSRSTSPSCFSLVRSCVRSGLLTSCKTPCDICSRSVALWSWSSPVPSFHGRHQDIFQMGVGTIIPIFKTIFKGLVRGSVLRCFTRWLSRVVLLWGCDSVNLVALRESSSWFQPAFYRLRDVVTLKKLRNNTRYMEFILLFYILGRNPITPW